MRWKPIRQATLRQRLLALVLPALALVLGLSLWATRVDALRAADAAFDRSLMGAIKGLDQGISTASGGLSVEQPWTLFEFFALSADGPVHYRVATDDGLVEIGAPDLPAPPRPLREGTPQFYDAVYFDQPVRVGALWRPLRPPVGQARGVVIQVAEATGSRQRFAATFVRQALVRDVLLLALLALLVAVAATLALRPVRALVQATRDRPPQALDPLPDDGLSADLQPLLAAINAQLARTAALLAQRRQFVDDASHQLRTPLTTLRAQLDYARRTADPAERRAALEALSGELAHASRATDQLLRLARADAAELQPEAFDLGDLAREVALALLPQARAAGIDFGVEAPDGPLPVHGDRLLWREALTNLAHNALVHGAGPVTIEAAVRPAGPAPAGVAEATAWARLSVIDAGPGLPEDLQARAGQRFAKGRGSRGAGLGLAMARAVAERHGGQLTLAAAAATAAPGLRVCLLWPLPDTPWTPTAAT
ncbi:MAG: hypothetical protein RLY78_1968 [Pseudomonadota bacterium]